MKRTIEIDVPAGFKPVITELCGMEGVITFVKDDEFWKEITDVFALHDYVRDAGFDDWKRDILEFLSDEGSAWSWIRERVADCLELQLLHGVIDEDSMPGSVDEKRYFPFPDGEVTCSTMRGIGFPWFLAYSTYDKARHVANHFGALLRNHVCGGHLLWT